MDDFETLMFLKRVAKSLSIGLLFLIVNMTLGIYFNLAFFENGIGIKNILYYLFFIVSLFFTVKILLKMWKRI